MTVARGRVPLATGFAALATVPTCLQPRTRAGTCADARTTGIAATPFPHCPDPPACRHRGRRLPSFSRRYHRPPALRRRPEPWRRPPATATPARRGHCHAFCWPGQLPPPSHEDPPTNHATSAARLTGRQPHDSLQERDAAADRPFLALACILATASLGVAAWRGEWSPALLAALPAAAVTVVLGRLARGTRTSRAVVALAL